jgi:hypothetical protein
MLLVFGCHDYGNGYFYRMQYGSEMGIGVSILSLSTSQPAVCTKSKEMDPRLQHNQETQ